MMCSWLNDELVARVPKACLGAAPIEPTRPRDPSILLAAHTAQPAGPRGEFCLVVGGASASRATRLRTSLRRALGSLQHAF